MLGRQKLFGPRSTFARENRSRRKKLHGNKEESKKEETLTVRETIIRTGQEFQPASREKHLLRGLSVSAAL
jgi:hypothetical protein